MTPAERQWNEHGAGTPGPPQRPARSAHLLPARILFHSAAASSSACLALFLPCTTFCTSVVMILFISTALGMPRNGDCAFAIAICWVNAENSVFSLNHACSATSLRAGKPPVPFAHISMPFGPDIHLTNRHAASLFWACVVTVLSEPRTIVPVVTPAGSGAMSYFVLGLSCF